MKQLEKSRRLTESGLMIALATILSFIQFAPWPNGGSITLFSMVPIALIAYRYGVKWGLLTGMTHGLLQMLIGVGGLRGISLGTVIGAVFLDYIFAFGVMGFSGVFKNIVKNDAAAFSMGAFLGGALRFVCHFLSGFLLWGSIIEDGFGAIAFSFTYNIGYMGPEILTTTVGALMCSVVLTLGQSKIKSQKSA